MFSRLLRREKIKNHRHDYQDEKLKSYGGSLFAPHELRSLKRSSELSQIDVVAGYFDVKNGYGKRALDVGCGYGYAMTLFKEFGYEVYGTDISKHILHEARGNLVWDVALVVHDIQTPLPFNKKFDLITCFEVLEHLKSPESAIENCYHALKPGGLYIVTTPNRLSPFSSILERDKEHINVRSAGEWKRCFSRFGWNVFKVFYRQWIPIVWRARHKNIFFSLPYLGVSLLIVAEKVTDYGSE